jgi:hypothetical protein
MMSGAAARRDDAILTLSRPISPAWDAGSLKVPPLCLGLLGPGLIHRGQFSL